MIIRFNFSYAQQNVIDWTLKQKISVPNVNTQEKYELPVQNSQTQCT